jgi:hypothetical protein
MSTTVCLKLMSFFIRQAVKLIDAYVEELIARRRRSLG